MVLSQSSKKSENWFSAFFPCAATWLTSRAWG